MTSLPVLLRLVLAHNVKHWGRALLGILGIAVSVCLVVWIIRGYEAAASEQSRSEAEMTRFDVTVAPPMPRVFPGGGRRGGGDRQRPPGAEGRGPGGPGGRPTLSDAQARYVDVGLIEQLRQDQNVAEVIPTVRSRVRMVDPPPAASMGPFGGGMLVGTDDGEPPRPLGQGRWLRPGADEAVLAASFAERNAIALGRAITVGGNGGEVRLEVVGLLAGALGGGGRMIGPMMSPALGDIYVSSGTAEKVNGFGGRSNAVLVVLKDREAAASFVETWTARTAQLDPPVELRALRAPQDDPLGGRMIQMIAVQAHNATGLAFLAACFIIFATLNASVRERLRQLAFLRAVAMTRGQLAVMIFLEAILLALLGWGSGLLLARGLVGLGTALAVHLRFFQAGAFADYPLGWYPVLASGATALVGSLAAAVLPAWQASRLRPIDLLGSPHEEKARKFPRRTVAIGLVLIIIYPVIVLLADIEPFHSLFAGTYSMGFSPPLLSCAAVIVGLAMVTPGFVWLIEALLGPVLAWVLRLDRRLLRQQLSGNLWRTVGTTIALSGGLAIFVTALVWGYSMLVPFTPDESLPRMLVSILPAGVPESSLDEVGRTPGVVADDLLGMAVEQPRLSDATLQTKGFASVDPSQEHLLFMGVQPERAFGRSTPVLDFAFLEGDRQSAARKLASGRYCLVPDHFQTQTGLGLGDRFSVEVPSAPGQTVEYEIAGVVSIPGWNWFTKFADIRRRAGRALAVVFAGYDQVKADFRLDRVSFFWMNVDPQVSFQELEQRLQPLADRHASVVVDVPGVGETMVSKQYVKTTERADLTERLFRRADDVIWSLTRFPLLALIIASLAVFNTIFASVRARFWQFGILRGVGMTGWGLFRLVLSESLMLFAAAGALSLCAGVLLAWCGIHICTYFFYFAGRTPPLVLPWAALSLGFGIAFGLCLLAGLIPAWQAARKEPLGFIAAGRLAM